MKEIFVQAQADHIESLFKATPLAAIEELVWNALDANAREVQIDLVMNPLGGIEAIRVSDDGTGIDVLKVDSTFGSLGGSWKRAGAAEVRGGCTVGTGAADSRLLRSAPWSNGARRCGPEAT